MDLLGPLNVLRTFTGPHTTTWGPVGHLSDKYNPLLLDQTAADTSAEIVWSTVSCFDAICLIGAKVVWYWYEIPLLILFSCHFDSSKFCIPVNYEHC